ASTAGGASTRSASAAPGPSSSVSATTRALPATWRRSWKRRSSSSRTRGRAHRGKDRGVNGAEALIRTLLACGVDTCFTNPGTSEMHFVAALDRIEGMRCILGLFEGVVTGAADGYGRMKDRPA